MQRAVIGSTVLVEANTTEQVQAVLALATTLGVARDWNFRAWLDKPWLVRLFTNSTADALALHELLWDHLEGVTAG